MNITLFHFSMDLGVACSTTVKVLITLLGLLSSFSFHLQFIISYAITLAIMLKYYSKVGCKHDNTSHTYLLFLLLLWLLLKRYSLYIVKILLKFFWKNIFKNLNFSSYYYVKFYVKNLTKNVIFKKIQIHLQVLLLFKNKHYNA